MNFIEAIQKAGGVVYEVGGTIRDFLLGIPLKDLDLIVAQLPVIKIQELLKKFGTVQSVGKSFGVLKFQPFHSSDQAIDIALPRTERSIGVGHRDFEIDSDPFLPIEKDLARRDFTINAIAKNLNTGEWVDPFNGKKDLENKILKQVFTNCFPEDPLRLLRAIQFSARFHLTIEQETFEAIKKNAHLIETVSGERVIEEIRKLFLADRPSIGFQLMNETGLIEKIFPDKIVDSFTVTKTAPLLDKGCQKKELSEKKNIELLFTILFKENFNREERTSLSRIRNWMTKYHVTMIGVNPSHIEHLLSLHDLETSKQLSSFEIRKLLSKIRKKFLSRWIDLQIIQADSEKSELQIRNLIEEIKKVNQTNPPLEISDLKLSGKDLKETGYNEGPIIGKILLQMLNFVLENPEKNKKEILLEEILRHYPLQTELK